MAQKKIREYDAKRMLAENLPKHLGDEFNYTANLVLVDSNTDWKKLAEKNPWLLNEKLVAKPDQLFGKRGKHGLLSIGKDFKETKEWIMERMNKETTVGKTTGTLTHFLIESFTPHDEKDEWYIAIKSDRDFDTIYFSTQGGIYVEENWDKVVHIEVPTLKPIDDIDIASQLPDLGNKSEMTINFIKALFKFFVDAGFTYLEINPFTFHNNQIVPLDLVARVDDTAAFECMDIWKDLDFPPAFGKKHSPEEQHIKNLDEKSGSSLKLTILNPEGRVWSMVAGGGASVIYADTIADLGGGKELANYGEYSGNPTTDETYEYAKTVLDLMTRTKHPDGKVLLIGGGIANFTDVAKTFTGIIKALKEFQNKLIDNKVRIYVRRGGPNFQEGLENMRTLGKSLGVPIEVYGPETHMTKIVSMALK